MFLSQQHRSSVIDEHRRLSRLRSKWQVKCVAEYVREHVLLVARRGPSGILSGIRVVPACTSCTSIVWFKVGRCTLKTIAVRYARKVH